MQLVQTKRQIRVCLGTCYTCSTSTLHSKLGRLHTCDFTTSWQGFGTMSSARCSVSFLSKKVMKGEDTNIVF